MMTIIVPPPPSNQPTVAREIELAVHRRNTEYFIAWNPYQVTLIPRERVKTGSGSSWVDGEPRVTQIMRLIPQSETTPPFTTADGKVRSITHVLLGRWDADMAIGDHWTDTIGSTFEIIDISTPNGYEMKALIEMHKVRG
jgi:hypothetical protein